jgi:hypothetical protein
MVEVVDVETIAVVPLIFTTLLDGVMLKFPPLITTVAPMAPLSGLIDVMVGDPSTLKLLLLVIVIPLTMMLMDPVVAPAGTVVVILVDVDAVTVAGIPLNKTALLAGVVLKFVPVITMVAPSAPLLGLNPVSVGVGFTEKLFALRTVIPFNVREILPVVAPVGTTVVRLVEVEAVTGVSTPLKCKILFAGVVLKLDPVIVTLAPTAPLPGVKPVMTGVGKT